MNIFLKVQGIKNDRHLYQNTTQMVMREIISEVLNETEQIS